MLAEGVYGEGDWRLAVRPADFLLVEIDFKFKSGFRVFRKLFANLLRKRDRKHAVLHSVIAEDIREARSDNATNAEVVTTRDT